MFQLIYKWTDKIKNSLSEKGQGMVEYAIVLAAVVAIAVAALWGTSTDTDGKTTTEGGLQNAVNKSFTNAATSIENANQKVDETNGSKKEEG